MYAAPNHPAIFEPSSICNSNEGPAPPKKECVKTPQNIRPPRKNAVQTLQNLQKQPQMPLNYQLVSQLGPQHSPTFVFCVEVYGQRFEGSGRTKKLAKQAAADASLRWVLQSKKAPKHQQTIGHIAPAATDSNVCDVNSTEMNKPPMADPQQKQNLEQQLKSRQLMPSISQASMEVQMQPVAIDKPKDSVVSQLEGKLPLPVSISTQASMGVQIEALLPVATEPKDSVVSQLEGKLPLPVSTSTQASMGVQIPVAIEPKNSVVSQLERKLPVSTGPKNSVVSQPEGKLPVVTRPKDWVVSQLEGKLPVTTEQKYSTLLQMELKRPVSTDTKMAVKPHLENKLPMSAHTVEPQVDGKKSLTADPKVFVAPQLAPKAPVLNDTNITVKQQLESKALLFADRKLAAGPQMKSKSTTPTNTKVEVEQELCRVLGNALRVEIQNKTGQVNPQYQALQHNVEFDRLKEGHELVKACEQTQRWLICGLGHLSRLLLVSADRSVLERQLDQHEPVYCEMLEKRHEVLQLLDRLRNFLSHSPQKPSIIDKLLEKDLHKIEQDWNQLSKELMDRNTRLQTCMKHYRKYNHMQSSSLPWLEEAESRIETLRPRSFSKGDISQHLDELKSFRNEVWCHSREFENTRTLGDTFLSACDMDREVMFNEMATMKQRWDALNKDVAELIDTLEDILRRISDYNNDICGLRQSLHRCEETFNFNNGLRPISSNSKHLYRMKALKEEIIALKPTLYTLRLQASCLLSLATGYRIDATSIEDQFGNVVKILDKLEARVDDCCSELQSAATAATQFNDRVKGLNYDLACLEEEFDAMKPPARDVYTVHAQVDEIIEFLCRISKVVEDVSHAADTGKDLVKSGSAVDTQGTREQVELFQQQLGRLKQYAQKREEILNSTLQRLKDLKKMCRSMVHVITNTWEQVESFLPVDNEVQRNKNREFLNTTIGVFTVQVHECNRIGQNFIQSAEVGVDTSSLEKDLERMNRKWNDLKKRALYESNKTMTLPDSTSCDPKTSQMTSADSTSSVSEPVSSSVPSQVLRSKPVEVIDLSDDDDIVCLGPQPSDKQTSLPVVNEMAKCSSPEKQNPELSSDIIQQPMQPCQQDKVSSVPLVNEMPECNEFEEEKSDLLCDDIEFGEPSAQQEMSDIRISEPWTTQDLDTPVPSTIYVYSQEIESYESDLPENILQSVQQEWMDAPLHVVDLGENGSMVKSKTTLDDINSEKSTPVIPAMTSVCDGASTSPKQGNSSDPSDVRIVTLSQEEVRFIERLIESKIAYTSSTVPSSVNSATGKQIQSSSLHADGSVPNSLLKHEKLSSQRDAPTTKTNDESKITLATKNNKALSKENTVSATKRKNKTETQDKLLKDEKCPRSKRKKGTKPQENHSVKTETPRRKRKNETEPQKSPSVKILKSNSEGKKETVLQDNTVRNENSSSRGKKEAVPQENSSSNNKKMNSKRAHNNAMIAKNMKQDELPENPPAVPRRGRPPKILQLESKEEGSPEPQSSRKSGRIRQQSNTNQHSKRRHKSTGKRKGSAQEEDAQCPVCQVWYLQDTSQGEWLECLLCKDWIHAGCTESSDYCRECCTDAECPECKDWFYINMSDDLWVKCLRCCRWTHKKCTPSADFCKACTDDINT